MTILSEKKNENKHVDRSELNLPTSNHTDFMTESDVATRYRQFIDAVDHVEKVSLQPYTLEITRAVQVLKVRDDK